MLRFARLLKGVGYTALMFLAGTIISSLASLIGFFKHGQFHTEIISAFALGLAVTTALFIFGLYRLETHLKLVVHK